MQKNDLVLKNLEEKLAIHFKDQNLLMRALTHRSFLNETKGENLKSNERLEFLGDSVLSLVISTFLFLNYSDYDEGRLTNLRSLLVKTPTLAKAARELSLGEDLFLSRGEEESGGRENQGILADTFEAITGAIYLDQGLKIAESFIQKYLLPFIPQILNADSLKDYKSLLQEKSQAREKASPVYKVLETSGPDHNRLFTVAVYVGNKEMGIGLGKSKQYAEQDAAKAALEKLNQLK